MVGTSLDVGKTPNTRGSHAECLGIEYMRTFTFSLQSAEPLIIRSCYSLVESVTSLLVLLLKLLLIWGIAELPLIHYIYWWPRKVYCEACYIESVNITES